MRITAHVNYGHPNGQRIRAGLTFDVAPQDYDVTDSQLAEIVADPAIVVTTVSKSRGEAEPVLTKAELLTIAKGLGLEIHGRTRVGDIRAAIDAKRAEIAAAAEVTRHAQGQTAAEQQAADELK